MIKTTPTQIVDVALICALQEEADAFLKHIPIRVQDKIGPYDCYFSKIENRHHHPGTLRLAVIVLNAMGNLASLHASTLLLKELTPQHIILFGICGGILGSAEDYRLGDVVLSTNVVYYEPGKTRPTGAKSRALHLPRVQRQDHNILMQSATNHAKSGWTAESLIGTPRPIDSQARMRPRLIQGRACSGEKVIADASVAAEMRREFDAVSIEMEAAGVAYACDQTDCSFLVIKGVSDYANSQKDDSHRMYAAATAAAFAYNLLKESPLERRAVDKLALWDLLRLVPNQPTEVMLPGYENPRHRTGWSNYPFNLYESAYDDVYCAMHIVSSLEPACGRNSIRCVFQPEAGIGKVPNLILIGSPVCNAHSRAALEEAYFRFGQNNSDHAIVDPTGSVCFDARIFSGADGNKVIDKDYGLLSVVRDEYKCTVVLAGCRAYGQMLLGDFLSDPQNVENLHQLTDDLDFQVVLEVKVIGRSYKYGSISALAVRKQGHWSRQSI